MTGRPVACWLRGRGSRSGPGWSWCLGTKGDRCGQVVTGEAGERVRHHEALQVDATEKLCVLQATLASPWPGGGTGEGGGEACPTGAGNPGGPQPILVLTAPPTS